MTLEEAIKTAIEFETKVTGVYRDAIAQTTDPAGKRIFEVLAKEEEDHLAYLQSRLDEWNKTGKVTAATLETAVPSPAAIAEGIGKLEQKVGQKKDHTLELDLLKRALEVERETGEYYKKLVGELDADGQKLFQRFAEIEEGHYAIVQAQIDSLSGMGFWFDFMEFNLEGG